MFAGKLFRNWADSLAQISNQIKINRLRIWRKYPKIISFLIILIAVTVGLSILITNIYKNSGTAKASGATVSFGASNASVLESSGKNSIPVVLDVGDSADVTVNYTLSSSSTASIGTDFNLNDSGSVTTGSITILSGKTSGFIPVSLINDTLAENNETVVVQLSNPSSGISLGSPNTFTLTILDDDQVSYNPLGSDSESLPSFDYSGINSLPNYTFGPYASLPVTNGLKLQLDASTISGNDGDAVSTWSDGSGNGNDATQASGGSQPKLYNNVLNGKKVVRFDGIDDQLTTGNVSMRERSYFIVSKRSGNATSTYTSLFLHGSNSPYYQLYAQNSDNILQNYITGANNSGLNFDSNFSVYANTIDTSSVRLYKNGAGGTPFSGITTSTVNDKFYISGNATGGDGYLNGDVAEILIYNRALGETERKQVECYLNTKYAVGGGLCSIGPKLQLDASTISGNDGDAVTTWNDSSASGNNATQTGAGSLKPTLKTGSNGLNSKNVVRFDGGDVLNFTNTLNLSDFNVMIVQKTSADSILMGKSNANQQIRIGNGNTLSAYNGATATSGGLNVPRTSFSLIGYQNSNNTLSFYENGNSLGSAGFGSSGISLNCFGSYDCGTSGGPNGDIAEILVYDRTLTDTERKQVECYLSNKYALNATVCTNGLKLQLDASTISGNDGDAVSTWNDSSGNGNNATQSTSTNQPILKKNAINGQSVLRFDGANDSLQTNYSTTQNSTVFSIFKHKNSGATCGPLWQMAQDQTYSGFFPNCTDGQQYLSVNSGDWLSQPTTFQINNPYLATVRYGTNLTEVYNNGSLVQSGGTNNIVIGNFQLGKRNADYFNGDIAEILVYNQALNDTERKQVECYLSKKYDLKASGEGSVKLWLDASQISGNDGDSVSTWTDKSGNGNDATGSGSAMPTLKTGNNGLNGKSVLRFDGSNNYLSLGDKLDLGTDNFSLLAVSKFNTSGGGPIVSKSSARGLNGRWALTIDSGKLVFLLEDTNGASLVGSAATNTLPSLNTVTINRGRTTKHFLNGSANGESSLVSTNTNLNTPDSFYLGQYGNSNGTGPLPGAYLNGDIAEVIILNTALNSTQKAIYENYLGNKYGITISSNIFNYSNSGNDLVGIGSGSDGVLSNSGSSAGLYLSELNNSLTVGDSLLAGHDGGAKTIVNTDLPSGITNRFNRTWAVTKTGLTGIDAKISFDFSQYAQGLPNNAGNYRLLYRSGTSGNFSVVSTSSATITSGDRISFNVSDADLVNGYYTLATTNSTASALSVPSTPTDTTATPVAENSTVNLAWTPPAGSTVSDYIIQYSDDNFVNDFNVFNDGVSTANSASVTGLNTDTKYAFRVLAASSAGTGNASNTATATTGGITPSISEIINTEYSNATGSTLGGYEVTINGTNFANPRYKRTLTIDNTAGTALTDYQVSFNLDTASLITAGKMRSDCGDLRITDSDDFTGLSYWIESGCNTAATTVWTKISNIGASSNKDIFIKYGDLSKTSAQATPESIFDFYDGFDGTSIDTTKWTINNSAGFSVSNGQLHGSNTSGRISTIQTFSSGVVQEIKAKTPTLASNGHMIGGFYISSSNSIGWLNYPGNAYYRNDGNWIPKSDQTPNNNMLYTIKVKNSTTVNLNIFNLDTNADYWNVGDISNNVSNEPIVLGSRYDGYAPGQGQEYQSDWDFIRVRKYSAATTSITAEQAASTVNLNFGTANPATNIQILGSTQIKATVPASNLNNGGTSPKAGIATVTLGVSGQTATSNFEYKAPRIDNLSVASGPTTGGTEVLVNGLYFGDTEYSRSITLNSTVNLTDYQISFNLDTASLISAGKMRSDCGDLRIKDSTGNTDLAYFIESGCNTASTVIWVKVPNVTIGSNTILLKYGNFSKTSLSNSSNVFNFYDDFNDLSKWASSGAVNIQDGVVTINNGGAIIKDFTGLPSNYTVESRYQQPSKYRNRTYLTTANSTTPPTGFDYGFFDNIYWNSFTGVDISANTWYKVSWENTPTNYTWNINQENETSVLSRSYGSKIANLSRLYFAGTDSPSSILKFDWIRIRQYTPTAPTVSVSAAEAEITKIYIGANQVSSVDKISSSQFRILTPTNILGTYPVKVVSPDETESNTNITFTYASPVVTSVSPNSGPNNGGTYVTVSGSNFGNAGTTATIGSNPMTGITIIDSQTLRGFVPAGAGTANITVTNSGGASGTSNTNLYTYGSNNISNPILDLAVTTTADGNVHLGWTAPFDNGSAITDYIIKYSQDNFSTETVFNDGVDISNSATVSGLTVGQNYQFKVIAVNAIGNSIDSNVASVNSLDCDTSLNGADWIISANTTITGSYCNIGLFRVNSGITATLNNQASTASPFTGKVVKIYAQNAEILGTVSGTGTGYLGGGQSGNSSNNGLGSGGGLAGSQGAGGGGYGGKGGLTNGGNAYGSITQPTDLGSGGGKDTYFGGNGGNGGGAVKLSVSGTTTINGSIIADGNVGAANYGPGGSGGSVWIDTNTLTGSGTITANGGASQSYVLGGGGGGRVALYYNTKNLTNSTPVLATGGSGNQNGGAGTVYEKDKDDSSKPNGTLQIDQNNVANNNANTPINSSNLSLNTLDTLLVTNKATASLDKDLTINNTSFNINAGTVFNVNNLLTFSNNLATTTLNGTLNFKYTPAGSFADFTIQSTGILTHNQNTTSKVSFLDITATNLTIDTGGKIDVTGTGYLGGGQSGNSSNNGLGSGGGLAGSQGAGGGGYGGKGGLTNGGNAYGSITQPTDLGSGGGKDTYFGGNGGNGGGAVKLSVSGTTTINGSIIADGNVGAANYGPGGSGGSVWIDTNTLTGSGTITANGGASQSYVLGGGGGGRVALYYNTKNLTNSTPVLATGGSGNQNGGAGTVYEKPSNQTNPDLTISNGTVNTGNTTPFGDDGSIYIYNNLTIQNAYVYYTKTTNTLNVTNNLTLQSSATTTDAAKLATLNLSSTSAYAFTNLTVKINGVLTHPANSTAQLNSLNLVLNTFDLQTGGKIDVTGTGYLGGGQSGNSSNNGLGSGGGLAGSQGAGGGGYGGKGGLTNGGNAYGSITQPTDLGSGGGKDTYFGGNGGNGGGAVKLSVSGTTTINGSIIADGNVGAANYGPGGSGGSVWIDTNTLTGSGTITANGGASQSNAFGGGGGGRIALYYQDRTGSLTQGTSSSSITVNGGTGSGDCVENTTDATNPNAYTNTTSGCTGTIYDPNTPEANLSSLTNANIITNPNPPSVDTDFALSVSGIKNTFGFGLYAGTCSVTVTGPGNYATPVVVNGTIASGICTPVGVASGGKFTAPTTAGSFTVSVSATGAGNTQTNSSLAFAVYNAASNKAKAQTTPNQTKPVYLALNAIPNPTLIGVNSSLPVLSVTGLTDSANDQLLNNTACNFNVSGPNSFSQTFTTQASSLVGGTCSYTLTSADLPKAGGQYSFTVSVAGKDSSNNDVTLTTDSTGFNQYFDIYLEDSNSPGSFNFTGNIPGNFTSAPTTITLGSSAVLTSPVIHKYDNSALIASGTVCKNTVTITNGSTVSNTDYSSTVNASGQCVTNLPSDNVTAGTLTVKTTVTLNVDSQTYNFSSNSTTIPTAGFPSNLAKSKDAPNGTEPIANTPTFSPTLTFAGESVTLRIDGLLDSAINQPLNTANCTFNISGPNSFAANFSTTATSGICTVALTGNDLPKTSGSYSFTVSVDGKDATNATTTLNTTPAVSFNRYINLYLSGGTNGLSGIIPATLTPATNPHITNSNLDISSSSIKKYDNTTSISSSEAGTTCRYSVNYNNSTTTYNGTINGGGQCTATIPSSLFTVVGTALIKLQVSVLGSDFSSDYTFETAAASIQVKAPNTAKICAQTFRDDGDGNADTTGDGIQNGTEPLLAGLTTRLRDDSNTVIATLTTSLTSGNNCFSNLFDGNYTLEQDLISDGTRTAPTLSTSNVTISGNTAKYAISLDAGATENRDFGYNGNANICISKTFIDINYNDSFDSGIDTILIAKPTRLYLSTDLNNPLASNVTDNSGQVCFNNKHANNSGETYVLEQDIDSNTTPIVLGSNGSLAKNDTVFRRTVILSFGQNTTPQSFGYKKLASNKAKAQASPNETKPVNTGFVFTTTVNGNPVAKVYKTRKFDVKVNGLLDSNNSLPLAIAGNGCSMAFSGPSFNSAVNVNGTVTGGICSIDPTPDNLGTGNIATLSVTGDNQTLTETSNFDVISGNANICVYPYADYDKNSTRNNSEPLISNVVTQIFDSSNNLLETLNSVSTAVGADNCFTPKAPDQEYTITQTAPTEGILTGSQTLTRTVTLTPEVNENLYFGYKGNSTICPSPTFRDDNRNAVKDNAEVNINGLSTTLKDSNNITVQTFSNDNTTCFTDLFSGNYSVTQIIPTGSVTVTTAGTVAGGAVTVSTSLNPAQSLDVKFGYASDAQICPNPTFADYNQNGTKDSNEPLISNLSTSLFRTSDNTQVGSSILTNGSTCFTQVIPDNYRIVQTKPNGANLTNTTGSDLTYTDNYNSDITKAAAAFDVTLGTSLNVNFGYKGNATICPNPTFRDNNSNGTKDSGEININGVLTTLKDSLGTTIATLNTNGSNCFNNLLAGGYRVVQNPPSGTTSTTGGYDVTVSNLVAGETRNVSFGYNGDSKICPITYRDDNSNQTFDTGEARLGEVNLTLKNSNGDTLETITSAGFAVCFNSKPEGTYTVQADTPSSYNPTTTLSRSVNLLFGVNQYPEFGYSGNSTICIISTFKDLNSNGQFNSSEDLNNNGILDIGEDLNGNGAIDTADANLDNITSYLKTASNSILQTKTTNSQGQTCFDAIPPGTYNVTQNAPNGTTSTTGAVQTVILGPSETKNLNFGYNGNSTVCVTIYNDQDFDKAKDSTEANLSDLGIKLYLQSDTSFTNPLNQKVSLSSGVSCFTSLFPENYTVKINAIPSGFGSTTGGDTQNVNITGSQYLNLEFGYTDNPQFLLSAIRGFLYIDRDENSITAVNHAGYEPYGKDTLETTVFDNDIPVTAQEIKLFKKNTVSNQFEEQSSLLSDNEGKYSFLGLGTGEYEVRVQTPLGTEAVYPNVSSAQIPSVIPITITNTDKFYDQNFSFQYTAKICPSLFVDKSSKNDIFDINGEDQNANTTFDNEVNLIDTGAYFQLQYQSFTGTQIASNDNPDGYFIKTGQNTCIEHVPPRNYTLIFRSGLTNGGDSQSSSITTNGYAYPDSYPNYGNLFDQAFYNQVTSNPSFTNYLGNTENTTHRYFTNFTINNTTSNLTGRVWNNKYSLNGFDSDGDDNKTGTEVVDGKTYNRDFDNDFAYPNVNLKLRKCSPGYGETQTDVDNFNLNAPTTQTDASGLYSFSNIPPGAYSVIRQTALPNEAALTNLPPNDDTTNCGVNNPFNWIFWNNTYNQSGGVTPGTAVNFDIQARYNSSIEPVLYIDQNHNGIKDAWENDGNGRSNTLLEGVLDLKTAADNITILSQKAYPATSNSIAAFYTLPPDSYTLNLSEKDSAPFKYPLIANENTSKTVTITSSNSNQIPTFGFDPTNNSTITGKVFIDRDSDNNFEENGNDANSSTVFDNDIPTSNAVVELYYGATLNPVLAQKVGQTTTDSNGNYTFSNLAEGFYSTRIVTPNPDGTSCIRCDWGYNDSSRIDLVYIEKDQTSVQNLRYNYNARIQTKAFLDTIDNLTRDASELDLNGLNFKLTYEDGYTVDTLTYNQLISLNSQFTLLPPGNYSVEISNIPNGSALKGASSPNNISLLASENLVKDYAFTPYTNNTVKGYVFIDRGALNHVFDPNGADNNINQTFDNETGFNGANVYIVGPLGTYNATTGNDSNGNPGYYEINNLPSGNYKLHTIQDDNLVSNVNLNNVLSGTVFNQCMTALFCKGLNYDTNGQVYLPPLSEISAQIIGNGIDLTNNTTIENNNTYIYSNTLNARCIDDRNGDGQVTYYPNINYTESPITGCSFRIKTFTNEYLNFTTNQNISVSLLPPGNYTIEKLNDITDKTHTNTSRRDSDVINLGPVNTPEATFNTSSTSQKGYFNFFEFSQPTTNNSSITGKVFVDKNEDTFFQASGLDGNPNTTADNDVLLQSIGLILTGPNGFSRTVDTALDGKYQFTDLPAGNYSITSNLSFLSDKKISRIKSITADGNNYNIEFQTYGYFNSPSSYRTALYYNTENKNINDKIITTSTSPYVLGQNTVPLNATKICSIVINPVNQVVEGSGNCKDLP